jgi:hypothetical protein
MRSLCLIAAACVAGCGSPQESAFFSFEGSLQGWTPQALDVETSAWSVTTDPGAPYDGPSSARLAIDDGTGNGRVWLERTFALGSSSRHRVHLDFAVLGTADPAAPDRLIVGALPAPPRSADALEPALQAQGIAGTRWTQHAYDFEIAGPSATVVVGVAAGAPGRTVYHLDALTVLFADAP